MSAFLIEPLGLMQPAYHNAAHLRFFLMQPANRHDVSAIKEFEILYLNIESLNIFQRWSTCSEDRCANFWSILTRVWPLSGSNCPVYNAHLSPNSWCSPIRPAPPTAFPSSISSNSTLSGIQTKSRITAFVPQVICPIHSQNAAVSTFQLHPESRCVLTSPRLPPLSLTWVTAIDFYLLLSLLPQHQFQ